MLTRPYRSPGKHSTRRNYSLNLFTPSWPRENWQRKRQERKEEMEYRSKCIERIREIDTPIARSRLYAGYIYLIQYTSELDADGLALCVRIFEPRKVGKIGYYVNVKKYCIVLWMKFENIVLYSEWATKNISNCTRGRIFEYSSLFFCHLNQRKHFKMERMIYPLN